jgi:hypothetical protein
VTLSSDSRPASHSVIITIWKNCAFRSSLSDSAPIITNTFRGSLDSPEHYMSTGKWICAFLTQIPLRMPDRVQLAQFIRGPGHLGFFSGQ